MGLEDKAEQIKDALAHVGATFNYLGNRSKLDGKFGYEDFSKKLEDFCKVFFLAVFDFKKLEVSYNPKESAVDLTGIDQNENYISIQVTSTQKKYAKGKIKKTFEGFKKKQQQIQIKKDKEKQLMEFEEYSLKSKKLLIIFIVNDDVEYTEDISQNYDFEYEILDNKKLVIRCENIMTNDLEKFISSWNSSIIPLLYAIPIEQKDLYSNVINAILLKRKNAKPKDNKSKEPPNSINGKIKHNKLERIKNFVQSYIIDEDIVTEVYEDNELYGGRPSDINEYIIDIYNRIIGEVDNSNNLVIFNKIIDELYDEALEYQSLVEAGEINVKTILKHLVCRSFIQCDIYEDIT